MNAPDIVNGLFEAFGAVALTFNVARFWQDRVLQGVHWLPTLFFTSWGLWNLFYYPHMHQWFSLAGASLIVVVNVAWLLSVAFLRRDQ